MNLEKRIEKHFNDSAQLKLATAPRLAAPIARAAQIMTDSLKSGGKVLACGNGGSAADAQHFSAELLGRFERERQELAAIALTTDTSAITAIANDYGYDMIFAKQVRGLGARGDVLIAISTSGNSTNVIEAMNAARTKGMSVVALTGRDGGKMGAVLGANDVHLNVSSNVTARIQEVHILILHCLCDAIDCNLLGAE
jgi:D-sedoheptulose 7-phosphate isomerase